MRLAASIKIGIIGLIGALLCAGGGVLYAIIPDIIKTKIKENLRIENGTEMFKTWLEVPEEAPIYMQFYLFNVTNHENILKKKEKPVLQQLGPYAFREYRKKVDIVFHKENDTVSYKQLKWFVHEPKMTNGSLDDIVTMLNVPLISVATVTEGKLDFLEKLAVNSLINRYKSQLFVTKTVDEMLFRGYQDELLIKLATLAKREILPNGTFGLFHELNDTDDGLYNVYTGMQDPDKAQVIAFWNNSKFVPHWNDKYCNMVNGSDGTTFSPFLQKDVPLTAFSTELCRSLSIVYEKESTVMGIRTYRYAPAPSMFGDRLVNPGNRCYCKDTPLCLYSGLLNISSCQKDAPIIMSYPHFYQADSRCLDAVVGLQPNELEHNSRVDIEPTTGVVLKVVRRIQLNLAVKPMVHLSVMKNAPNLIFPLFWVNESAQIDGSLADKLKMKLYMPLMIAQAVPHAFVGIGIVLLFCAIFFIAKQKATAKYKRAPNDKKDPAKMYPMYDPVSRPIYEPAAESLMGKDPLETNHVRV